MFSQWPVFVVELNNCNHRLKFGVFLLSEVLPHLVIKAASTAGAAGSFDETLTAIEPFYLDCSTQNTLSGRLCELQPSL